MKVDTQKLVAEFINYLENLPDEQWNTKVAGGWTVKEIIAHLIGWEKEAIKELPKAWKNHQKPWFMNNNDDYVKFNAANIVEYNNYSPKELIKEWKTWKHAFELEIKKVGEDKLRADYDFFEWVFDESGNGHYLEHFDQIKSALKRVT